jgi:homoserine O-acetyltransferase
LISLDENSNGGGRMKQFKLVSMVVCTLLVFSIARSLQAADYPAPKEASWIVRDFRFHTGETLPELRLHYTTVGSASGEAVLLLHGTDGSAANLLNAGFAGELFGPGQPLDATRYFIILPDALGAGKSSKPSDQLRTRFPRYNYDDMVRAQYRLVTEHLGLTRLRLILGQSMGGMHTWLWGTMYPDFMYALVPMASMPTEVAGRNWMTRRMLIESIRNDPEWNGGNYTKQPRSLHMMQTFSASPPAAAIARFIRRLRPGKKRINW